MHKKSLSILVILTALFCVNISVAKSMKPHHKNAGLKCGSCHINKPFSATPMDQCLTCHTLPEKKQDYHGAPDNHDSPHYGPTLECENCHLEHETSVNFCNDCHEFDFKVP